MAVSDLMLAPRGAPGNSKSPATQTAGTEDRLSKSGRAVIGYLRRLQAKCAVPGVFPSVATIARECGCCERTVKRQLRELERRGMIRVVIDWKVGTGRRYHLADLAPVAAESRPDVTPRSEPADAPASERADGQRDPEAPTPTAWVDLDGPEIDARVAELERLAGEEEQRRALRWHVERRADIGNPAAYERAVMRRGGPGPDVIAEYHESRSQAADAPRVAITPPAELRAREAEPDLRAFFDGASEDPSHPLYALLRRRHAARANA